TPTSPMPTSMPTTPATMVPLGAAALVGRLPTAATAAELTVAPDTPASSTDPLVGELAGELAGLDAQGDEPILVQAIELESKSPEGGIQAEIVLLPTATPTHTPLPDLNAELNIPKVEIVPALGLKVTPTPEPPTPTPESVFTPTATPAPVGPGRLWSTFQPKPAAENDHFWIGNPFADFASNRFASPSYQFGSTAGN